MASYCLSLECLFPADSTGEVHTRLVPTWTLSPGSCTQSLAMEVALQQGVEQKIVGRAQQLLQELWEGDSPALAVGVTRSRPSSYSPPSGDDEDIDSSSSSSAGASSSSSSTSSSQSV